MTRTLLDMPKNNISSSLLSVLSGNIADYPPGSSFGPRTATNFEFVWLYRGKAQWFTDDELHPLDVGSVLLSRPGDRENYEWDQHQRTRHGFIHFNLTERGYHELPEPAQWPRVRYHSGENVLIPLLKHCVDLLSRSDAASIHLAQQSCELALSIFLNNSGDISDHHAGLDGHSAIDACWEFLQQRWQHKVWLAPSLEELAAAAHVTAVHLGRLFKQHVGTSPMDAIRLLRLDRSAKLLARTDRSVADIGAQCGFANPFHFSRSFTKVYKCAPSVFRERALAGAVVPQIPIAVLRRRAALL